MPASTNTKAALLAIFVFASTARAAALAVAASPSKSVVEALQLQVYLNGVDIKLIAGFRREADGSLSSTRSELQAIGVKVPGSDPNERVRLDDIPGLTYVYDEKTQSIRLQVAPEARAVKFYDALRGLGAAEIAPERDFGALLNYDLYTSTMRAFSQRDITFQGLSATLEARLLTPVGTLSQTGIVGSTMTSADNFLRLDSSWTYSDPRSLVTYRLGDTISSGLAWTRPIRMGGVQIQRNFSLRPDLVTLPLPNISGSAAVPSTVDVYVNNVKAYSQQVQQGPYRISDLPVVGAGTAKVVVYDAAGHQVQQTLPFITSPLLLRPGFVDYSAEIGAPRNFYGVLSDSYAPTPVFNGSLRWGLTNWLTLEGHSEDAFGLVNVGAGAVVNVFSRAIVNVAVEGSRSRHGYGGQVYGSVEYPLGPLSLSFTGQYSFGRYDDLASFTAATAPFRQNLNLANGGGLAVLGLIDSVRPPKEIATLSIGAPLPFIHSSLGLALTHSLSADNRRSDIGSLSFSRGGPFHSSIFVTAFADAGQIRELGVMAGITVPIGARTSASLQANLASSDRSVNFQASRYLDLEPGSYGWNVNDIETSGQNVERTAQVSYRSAYGAIQAGGGQIGDGLTGNLELRGALATMGGGFFASNTINDAFAVVNAGAPNIKVYDDNRYVGKTGTNGMLLAPQLLSWQRNAISIDPTNLPLDADAARTKEIVRPADRGGVYVDFGVKTHLRDAVVVFVDSAGKPVPAGTAGVVEGTKQSFVVGYDGRAYLIGLKPSNAARLQMGVSECRATFAYRPPREPAQPTIGPVVCQ